MVIVAAASLGVTPAQVGLAWLLATYANTLLIPGTLDPAIWRRTSRRAMSTSAGETIDTFDGIASSAG